MTPIYYDGTTGLQGNGLGALRDAIYCTVTEERNGSYELEMQYPITAQHYNSLALRGLIKARPNPYSEPQYFRIYKISRPINGLVTINAQHINYDLSGVPVEPFAAGTAAAAMAGLKEHAAAQCSFNFWTDKETSANFSITKPASLRSMLGGVDGSILDVYGGEYEWDNYTVKLYDHRGSDRGVTIRYGKNLTDLKQEENCSNVYTGVYPYWVDDDGNLAQISGDPIVMVPGTYDFVHILVLDLSQDYENAPTDEQMKQEAQRYIKANDVGVPKVSLTVSFAQLEQTEEYKGKALLERVSLCDTVHVSFERLGVNATSRVIKTVYNVLLDRYDSVELGSAKSNLATTVATLSKETKTELDKTKSTLQAAIDKATQLITGNLGGYVVLHSSTGNDAPDEILVMDKPDINTATKVWRWNLSGWGYSGTGYAGPYRLAATMDGEINADFITTGSLTANIIKTGLLQDHAGKSSINLDTGEINLECKTLRIQGKTTEEIAEGKANEAGAAAKEAASAELNAYKEAVTKDLGNMQAQIDGQIETWFYEAEPATTTPPASEWTTEELKENHAGDLYYSGKGYAYRWTYTDNAWGWLQIKDTDITSALQNAKKAQETANSKRRTFLSQPVPPYDIGDLWANGTDLLACVNSRGEGASYDANDWALKTQYTTKKEAQLIVDASIEKIELGITEKVEAENLFDGGRWIASSGSATGATGSVSIDGDMVTIVAPSSSEQAKYSGASWNVPSEKLKAAQGATMEISFEYRVNAEISTNTEHASHILMWANYASGNVSTIVVRLATSSYAEPVGGWKKASATYQFKAEIPTGIYAFAYLYGGTGSVSVRSLTLKQTSSKTSVISLTKSGTVISASELNLNEYAKTAEVNVAIDSIKLGITQENTYADVDLGSTTWTGTTTGASAADGVLTLNHIKRGLVYGVFALPKSARNTITAHKIKISLDYRVTSELDARSYVTLYVTYADGTGIQKIIATICNSTTSVPVSDWKTVSYEIELESKDLSKVEITPMISSGTTGTKGSYEVKNVAIQYVYSYANKFELTKDGTVISSSKTASTKAGDFVTSAELNVKTDEITATVVKDGEVRSKFALDSSNCTITSGIITFNSNSLVVNSDNFKLTRNGTVTATGSFTSKTDLNSVILGNGQVSIERKLGDGSWRRAATLIGYGSNDAQAQLQMYANNSLQVLMQSSFTGSELYMYHANNVVHTEMKSVNGAGSIWLRYSDGRSLFHVYNDPNTGRSHVVFDGELECKSIKRDGKYI